MIDRSNDNEKNLSFFSKLFPGQAISKSCDGMNMSNRFYATVTQKKKRRQKKNYSTILSNCVFFWLFSHPPVLMVVFTSFPLSLSLLLFFLVFFFSSSYRRQKVKTWCHLTDNTRLVPSSCIQANNSSVRFIHSTTSLI
jgi:hypothetical protein